MMANSWFATLFVAVVWLRVITSSDALAEDCRKVACENNGLCSPVVTQLNTTWMCQCPAAYAGPYCSYEDPCHTVQPCTKGQFDYCSFTLLLPHHYHCLCLPSYFGRNCQLISPQVEQLDSENSAESTAKSPTKKTIDLGEAQMVEEVVNLGGESRHRSTAPVFKDQKNLSIEELQSGGITACTSSPCQNHGYCEDVPSDGPAAFVCHCDTSFKGELCQDSWSCLDDAEGCFNGGVCELKAWSVPGSGTNAKQYGCTCKESYTGARCEILRRRFPRLSTVLIDCNGVMIELLEEVYSPTRKRREAESKADGLDTTDIVVGERYKRQAAKKPCQNKATCKPKYVSDIPVDYTCICTEGWTGRACQIQVCQVGYYGTFCEQVCPPHCRDNECGPNGDCLECVPGFGGLRCNNKIGVEINMVTGFRDSMAPEIENDQSEEYATFRDAISDWILGACEVMEKPCWVSPEMLFSTSGNIAQYSVMFNLQGDTNVTLLSESLKRQLIYSTYKFSVEGNNTVKTDSIDVSSINTIRGDDLFTVEDGLSVVQIAMICTLLVVLASGVGIIIGLATRKVPAHQPPLRKPTVNVSRDPKDETRNEQLLQSPARSSSPDMVKLRMAGSSSGTGQLLQSPARSSSPDMVKVNMAGNTLGTDT